MSEQVSSSQGRATQNTTLPAALETADASSTCDVTDPTQTLLHERDPSLLEPYRYINSIPGKDVRGKLVDCFQLWLQIPSDSILQAIKDIVADLYNASLLIDDIEDNSNLRRGVPVAHHIFGTPAVINCANYVYFLALERCHALRNEEATHVFVMELLNLHRGQGACGGVG